MTSGFSKAADNPRWTGGPVECVCRNCGVTFLVRRSKVDTGRGQHCSAQCRKETSSILKSCESCGNRFWVKKSREAKAMVRYCSLSCRSKGWAERGVRQGKSNGRYIDGTSTTKEYDCRKSHRRRKKVEANGGDYSIQEWLDLCSRYENRCLCCGRDDVALTVDHVVPLSKGGSNDIANIQPLCKSCNSKKRVSVIDYR